MKSNAILFGILTVLLILAFFLVEKPQRDARKRTHFLPSNTHELLSLEGMNFQLKSKDGQKNIFHEQHYPGEPLSEKKLNEYFDFLSSLKVLRFFETEESKELPQNLFSEASPWIQFVLFDPDTKKNQSFKLTLGSPLELGEGFYFRLNKEIGVMNYPGKAGEVYLEKGEKIQKYGHLQEYLNWKPENFLSYSLFFKEDQLPEFHTIEVENPLNRPFTLDLKTQVTIPKQISNLGYKEGALQEFKKEILQIRGQALSTPTQRKVLKTLNPHAHVTLGKKIRINFFKLMEGPQEKFFIQNTLRPQRFVEVHLMQKNLFYRNMQDFWQMWPQDPEGHLVLLKGFHPIRLSLITSTDRQVFQKTAAKEKVYPTPSGNYQKETHGEETLLIEWTQGYKIHFMKHPARTQVLPKAQ